MIRSGMESLRGTERKRGIPWAETLPGEWAVLAACWASQLRSPTQGRWAHLAGGRASGTNGKARGSLDAAHEEYAHACLLPKQGGEGRLRAASVASWLPQLSLPLPQPKLVDHSGPSCFTKQLHTGTRAATQRPELGYETQSGSGPKPCLSRAGAAITGTYTGSTSEAALTSVCGWTTMACVWTHAESLHRPFIPCGPVPHQDEGNKGWRESSVVKDKGSSEPTWHLNRVGAAFTGTHRGSASEVVQVSAPSQIVTAHAPTHTENPYHPFYSRIVPIWGKDEGAWGRRKHTLLVNKASSDSTLRDSAPST